MLSDHVHNIFVQASSADFIERLQLVGMSPLAGPARERNKQRKLETYRRIPSILGGSILGAAAASPYDITGSGRKNLRRARQAKGLSQEELADRAGINRNYVGMLEREEHAATVDMLEKLADVLEIDPSEFLDRTR